MKCLLAAASLAAAAALFSAARNDDFGLGKNIEILVNLYRDLNLFYVDTVDADRMLDDAAYGMVSRLDPYTEFLSEEKMSEFEFLSTGKYGGIGSLIRQSGDYVQIARPYKGSPADRAGLKIGDKILAIDGRDAKGWTTSEVSAALKGDPGTPVKLRIRNFYDGTTEEKEILRERIAISGVPWYGFVSDSIGYIQHNDFTEACSEDMVKAFMEMKNTGRLKGLILDYRSNNGGILQEAVKILSMFVPKGTTVVSMKGRQRSSDAEYRTESEPLDTQVPIVVLTNSGTASAAEIVSGALQDLDRAVLVGSRTYGKGLVQSTRPLAYNSYVKVTTAKYYIPSGRCIQAIDYAHRNEDGSVASVPDSLRREFKTLGGRSVFDGGGITPDVEMTPEYVSRFALVVYGKGYIDEFGDAYALATKECEIPLEGYELPDSVYAAFVEFMTDKDVEFESNTKRAVQRLREAAESELYLEGIEEQIAAIEENLKDDKQSNLEIHRKELSELIEDDVLLRRYYLEGVTSHAVARSAEVLEAIELLGDRARYDSILGRRADERAAAKDNQR